MHASCTHRVGGGREREILRKYTLRQKVSNAKTRLEKKFRNHLCEAGREGGRADPDGLTVVPTFPKARWIGDSLNTSADAKAAFAYISHLHLALESITKFSSNQIIFCFFASSLGLESLPWLGLSFIFKNT